jgi:hypothetical protein
MSLYDPERDRVRIAGRWLRWSARWVLGPLIAGVFVASNVDVRALPLVGGERLSAVLLLDGQAYFGHLDDSGESGTLLLRDVYYFKSATGGSLPVGLVRRGTEAHEPADGMRINRDRVFAVERVGGDSAVAQAIEVDRELERRQSTVSLNPITVASATAVAAQRQVAERALQRGWLAAVDQLRKVNDLVLPVTKADAQAITQKAIGDLRSVRRNALGAIAAAVGMSAADAEAYVRTTDPVLEAQTTAGDAAAVLLAPDLDAVVNKATQLYAQVGDAAAKQLTQTKATASPSPRP